MAAPLGINYRFEIGQTEAARKYHRARILGEGEPTPALTAWIKEASE